MARKRFDFWVYTIVLFDNVNLCATLLPVGTTSCESVCLRLRIQGDLKLIYLLWIWLIWNELSASSLLSSWTCLSQRWCLPLNALIVGSVVRHVLRSFLPTVEVVYLAKHTLKLSLMNFHTVVLWERGAFAHSFAWSLLPANNYDQSPYLMECAIMRSTFVIPISMGNLIYLNRLFMYRYLNGRICLPLSLSRGELPSFGGATFHFQWFWWDSLSVSALPLYWGESIPRISSGNRSGLKRNCWDRCSRSFAIHSSHWCRHFLAILCDKLRQVSFWFLSFWGENETTNLQIDTNNCSPPSADLSVCISITTTFGDNVDIAIVGNNSGQWLCPREVCHCGASLCAISSWYRLPLLARF